MEDRQIGSYRIERLLGEGGMGVVYVGVDVRLERRAAIKRLLPELSHQPAVVERFFNEARAAASIDHPGIVEIYEVGWHTDGSAYFAMKLLEGVTLARRLAAAGPMPPAYAAAIGRQMASALAAAHARGIVHRDLKPDNVMMVPDEEIAIGERAVILDFGIAKLFGERATGRKTRTGGTLGTPVYMSPEQCRGAGEVDHRTDIYALGCILFELLSGRPPFDAEGGGEILGMHLFVPPPELLDRRRDLPPALAALVMRMLAKRADHRPQTMAEVGAALAALTGWHAPSPGPTSGATPVVSSTPTPMPLPTPIASLTPAGVAPIASLTPAGLAPIASLTPAGLATLPSTPGALVTEPGLPSGMPTTLSSLRGEVAPGPPRRRGPAIAVGAGVGLAVAAVFAIASPSDEPKRARPPAAARAAAIDPSPARVAAIDPARAAIDPAPPPAIDPAPAATEATPPPAIDPAPAAAAIAPAATPTEVAAPIDSGRHRRPTQPARTATAATTPPPPPATAAPAPAVDAAGLKRLYAAVGARLNQALTAGDPHARELRARYADLPFLAALSDPAVAVRVDGELRAIARQLAAP